MKRECVCGLGFPGFLVHGDKIEDTAGLGAGQRAHFRGRGMLTGLWEKEDSSYRRLVPRPILSHHGAVGHRILGLARK